VLEGERGRIGVKGRDNGRERWVKINYIIPILNIILCNFSYIRVI
jgi:hypothetical protein